MLLTLAAMRSNRPPPTPRVLLASLAVASLASLASTACNLLVGFGDDPPLRKDRDDTGLRDAGPLDAIAPFPQWDAGTSSDASRPVPEAGTCADPLPADPSASAGHVYFRTNVQGGAIHRIRAEAGAKVESLQATFRAAGPPGDDNARYEYRDFTASRDGRFTAFVSERWQTGGGPGELYLAPTSASVLAGTKAWAPLLVKVDEIGAPTGAAVTPQGKAVPARDARFLVFEHSHDFVDGGARYETIWMADKRGEGVPRYGKAQALVGPNAPQLVHRLGDVSPDETRVVTGCGPDRPTTGFPAICETTIADRRTVVRVQAARPGLSHAPKLSLPSYDRDGAILFEANWRKDEPGYRQIWRARAGCEPVMVTEDTQDNWHPCALPNGNIAMKTKVNGTLHVRIVRPDKSELLLEVPPDPEFTDDTGLYCAE